MMNKSFTVVTKHPASMMQHADSVLVNPSYAQTNVTFILVWQIWDFHLPPALMIVAPCLFLTITAAN